MSLEICLNFKRCRYFAEFKRLCEMAQRRKQQAFRPGTNTNHQVMIKKYIGFCIQHDLQYINPEINTLCVYVEYLVQSFSSVKSVNNYISAIRFLHKMVNIHPENMDSFELTLMLRRQ